MKKVKPTRRVYGILLLFAVLMAGIQANAAKALNQAFAVMAGSVLLDKNTISYTAVLPELPVSDDGIVYLYEMQPFEYAVAPAAVPVASAPASQNPAFTLPYTEARLYTKLGLAVKSGGQNVLIANPQYIANPELLATHTKARQARPLKSEQGKDFCNMYLSENASGVIAGRYTTARGDEQRRQSGDYQSVFAGSHHADRYASSTAAALHAQRVRAGGDQCAGSGIVQSRCKLNRREFYHRE